MKHLLSILIFTISFFIYTNTGFSQENTSSISLKKYSKEELAHFNKKQVKFINYCLKNACYFTAVPKEKLKNNKDRVGNITIQDMNHFDSSTLNIKLIQNDYQYFVVENEDKLLVVKSIDHLKKAYNENK